MTTNPNPNPNPHPKPNPNPNPNQGITADEFDTLRSAAASLSL